MRSSGQRTFVAVLGFALLVFVGIVVVWAVAFDLGSPTETSNDSGYQNWGLLGGFVFGTSAAIAVAWATVRLADAANQMSARSLAISENADRREGFVFVDARLTEVVDDFVKYAWALSMYLASVLPIYARLAETGKNDDGSLQASETEIADLLAMVSSVKAHQEELAAALQVLAARPVSGRIASLALANRGSMLDWLDENDPSFDRGGVRSDDLIEVASLLRVRATVLSDTDITEHLFSQILATNMSGGHAAHSGVLFAGLSVLSTGDEHHWVAVGAAIIDDLARMLPLPEEIASVVASAYAELGVAKGDMLDRLPSEAFGLGYTAETGLARLRQHPGTIAFPPLSGDTGSPSGIA